MHPYLQEVESNWQHEQTLSPEQSSSQQLTVHQAHICFLKVWCAEKATLRLPFCFCAAPPAGRNFTYSPQRCRHSGRAPTLVDLQPVQ